MISIDRGGGRGPRLAGRGVTKPKTTHSPKQKRRTGVSAPHHPTRARTWGTVLSFSLTPTWLVPARRILVGTRLAARRRSRPREAVATASVLRRRVWGDESGCRSSWLRGLRRNGAPVRGRDRDGP